MSTTEMEAGRTKRTDGEEERLSVAGVTIALRRAGSGGPTVLYLHGIGGIDASTVRSLAGWGRVWAPSHPGFGRSDLPRGMTSVDDLAYFYLDLIDEAGLKNVVLVGSSFGGWIAAEMAVKSTARIARLVLADAVGIKVGDRETAEIFDIFGVREQDLPDVLFHDADRLRPDYAALSDEELTVIARNRESAALFGWKPYMYDPKLRQRLHRIKVPTLVLWGAHDRIVSTDYGRAYAEAIPQAAFDLIDNAGHRPDIEQPETFSRRVAKFASES